MKLLPKEDPINDIWERDDKDAAYFDTAEKHDNDAHDEFFTFTWKDFWLSALIGLAASMFLVWTICQLIPS